MWNNEATPGGIKVISKAVRVLEAFEGDRESMRLAEICRRVDMPRGSAHRLLGELVRHGLLGRTGDTYRLGVKLFVWGSLVQRRNELRRIARPHMEYLAEHFRTTSLLAVREGALAVCIDRVDRGDVHNAWFQIGGTLPIHSGGSAKALLAGASEADLRQYFIAGAFDSALPHLKAGLAGLLQLADDVRRNGYSISDGDVVHEIASIGAPIHDAEGSAQAAISVTGLRSAVLGADRRDAVIEAVTQAAAAISRELGYVGDPQGGLDAGEADATR